MTAEILNRLLCVSMYYRYLEYNPAAQSKYYYSSPATPGIYFSVYAI